MRLGMMLRDVSISLLRRPITERYPFERRVPPDRLRGKLVWDSTTCQGCGLCAQDCPANAIEVAVLNREEKRFVLFYYPERCAFCAQCVQSCRHGSLALSNDVWELAVLNRDQLITCYGETKDVRHVLEERASNEAPAGSGE